VTCNSQVSTLWSLTLVGVLRNPNQTRQPMTIFSSHVFEFFLITRYHKMTGVNYVL